MSKILLIEDDRDLATALGDQLAKQRYEVIHAASLFEAKRIELATIGVILLDWSLPDGEGVDWLAELRKEGCAKPIILLTARDEVLDKVLALELGANDYISKPFHIRELVARIRVQERLSKATPTGSEAKGEPDPARIRLHGIDLDADARTVRYRESNLELSKMEFDLLQFFMENAGRALARDEILNKVWGFDNFPDSRTVDAHVVLLRKKLDPTLFETLRGVGYRFKGEGK